MKNQNWTFPARIDFSCYIDRKTASYVNLTDHVLNDASASLTVLGTPDLYGVAETYYFTDGTQRKEYGRAFATTAASNPRLDRLSFWTTPDGGGQGINIAYPFAIEDYLPWSTSWYRNKNILFCGHPSLNKLRNAVQRSPRLPVIYFHSFACMQLIIDH